MFIKKINTRILSVFIAASLAAGSALSFALLSFFYPVKLVAVYSDSLTLGEPKSLFRLTHTTLSGNTRAIDAKRISANELYDNGANMYEVQYVFKDFPPVVCYVSYDFNGGGGNPSAPSREGFSFLEWVKAETTDSNHARLSAVWSENYEAPDTRGDKKDRQG